MNRLVYYILLVLFSLNIFVFIFWRSEIEVFSFATMIIFLAAIFYFGKKCDKKDAKETDVINKKPEQQIGLLNEAENEVTAEIKKVYELVEPNAKSLPLREIILKIGERISKQEEQIENYKVETENYRKELTVSYNNLLAKSTEIEYTNMMLEKRVTRVSALNAVGKAVLSELEMDRIISTILDSYIVLISAKKIILYLFENEILVQKAMRGNCELKSRNDISDEDIIGGKESKYYEEYLKKGRMLLEENEFVIISELKVKGKELGVLFIIEEKDEEMNIKKEEMDMISALNIYASIAINNAKMYRELADKQRLEKEIGIAREIQLNLLPKDIKSVFGLEIANHFEPAKEVGGDYYDYFISAEGKFGIAIGDVSGKGMPAALLMTTIRAILRTIASYDLLPDIVMTRLNNVIFQDINEEMFVTLFYSLYDYETSTMFFSNAGHNPVIIYDTQSEKVIERNVKGTAIGFSDNYNYKLDKIKLNYNDVLVFYTDGITEAENASGELFGIERLKQSVEELKDLTSEKIKKGILAKVDEFRNGYMQVDDITLVVLKYKGWV